MGTYFYFHGIYPRLFLHSKPHSCVLKFCVFGDGRDSSAVKDLLSLPRTHVKVEEMNDPPRSTSDLQTTTCTHTQASYTNIIVIIIFFFKKKLTFCRSFFFLQPQVQV